MYHRNQKKNHWNYLSFQLNARLMHRIFQIYMICFLYLTVDNIFGEESNGHIKNTILKIFGLLLFDNILKYEI